MPIEVRSSGQWVGSQVIQSYLQLKFTMGDVQDDVNIADDADDEAEEEDEEQQVDEEDEEQQVDEEDEEQQVDEEEDVNVDGEDDDEEHLQFIDSDYEQTDEEQEKQKGVEDDRWFDRHVVDEAAEEPQREPGDVPSDDYNLEDLLSVSKEEDEVDENTGVKKGSRRRKAHRFKQFKRDTDLFNPIFHIGMEFANMEQCREAIRFYAVSSARPLRWVKNDPHRVRVVEVEERLKKKGLGKMEKKKIEKNVYQMVERMVEKKIDKMVEKRVKKKGLLLGSRHINLSMYVEGCKRPSLPLLLGLLKDFMKIVRKNYCIDITAN
ncbi:unnamed protein product [Prunus armeniaca]